MRKEIRILAAGITLFLLAGTVRAWTAEWIYPLDESSLWKAPEFGDFFEEIRRAEEAKRVSPGDPRYAHRLARLYFKGVSEKMFDAPGKEGALRQAKAEVSRALRARPVFAEYLVAYALFVSSVESFPPPDEIVQQALFLAYPDHAIRAFAATYYQYRGRRDISLALWRSIVGEDPTRTREAAGICFNYYRDESFILDLAPRETEKLIRFQGELLENVPVGGPSFAKKALPLLVERSEGEPRNVKLLGMIAATYRQAGDEIQVRFWEEKARQAEEGLR